MNQKLKNGEKNETARHSWHIVLLLVFATIGGALGIGYFVQRNIDIRYFDDALYQAAQNMPHPAWLNTIIAPFNFNFLPFGQGLPPSFILVGIILFLIWMGLNKQKLFWWALLAMALGFLYEAILFEIISNVMFRARPFTVLPNTLSDISKQAWITWTSFPSGHTRGAMLYGTIIYSFLPKFKWAIFLFAGFIAFSRVYLGAHYPTDVIAGLLIGFLAGKIAVLLTKEIRIILEKSKIKEHGDHPKT